MHKMVKKWAGKGFIPHEIIPALYGENLFA